MGHLVIIIYMSSLLLWFEPLVNHPSIHIRIANFDSSASTSIHSLTKRHTYIHTAEASSNPNPDLYHLYHPSTTRDPYHYHYYDYYSYYTVASVISVLQWASGARWNQINVARARRSWSLAAVSISLLWCCDTRKRERIEKKRENETDGAHA